MRFDVFSLFPEVFQPYLDISILKRAIQNNLIEVHTHKTDRVLAEAVKFWPVVVVGQVPVLNLTSQTLL